MIPCARDPARAGRSVVGERAPCQTLLCYNFLQFLYTCTADMHAKKYERASFQVLHERPLVWPLRLSGESDVTPEIEEYNISAVIAQFELHAVLVYPFDIRRPLSDTKIL